MFGSHLSIAGGLHNALSEAEKLGMDCVQVFTKNQQQWKCKPLEDEAIAQWLAECRRMGFNANVSHDSYLINLASPVAELRQKSIQLFVEEVTRCGQLKIPYLVAHPEPTWARAKPPGCKRVADALDEVYAMAHVAGVITCLEITAGQGTSLGWRLEHLAQIISQARCADRLAVCLDTAHLFAAGYDFRGRKYPAFRKEVAKTVGLERVKVLHLNDSKKELGSRVDRHEHIGRGKIGLEGFKPFVRDEAFVKVPKILETPKEKDAEGRDWDVVNIEALRSLLR